MKRVVIVHCWDEYPDYCWYPQAKKELEEREFNVVVPEMPETSLPKLSSWLPKLQEVAANPNEDLYLVGHSVGCVTILRYLEKLKENEKVGGVVLVAGFTDSLIYEELKNFFETPVDYELIKTKSNSFVVIQSDNDPFVPLKHGDILKEKLGAKLITKRAMGHFSGAVDDTTSVTSLPEVANEIIKMSK